MAKKTQQRPEDFIVPLDINGMQGRMLHLPAPKGYTQREVLVVYGHHSSLERWWGLAQNFNKYGAVIMPDLPGFGGMDSLYKIGKKPSLDNMADYLASFVKWRYKRKKVVIIGLSYGFLVTTRMLQRYPELTGKVEMLISAVGFSHYEDFVFSQQRMRIYRLGTKLFSYRLPALVFRYGFLNSFMLRKFYADTAQAKHKFEGADAELSQRLMAMELVLWHANNVQTHMYTNHDMLTVDNCQRQVDLPLWHVSAGFDQYFDPYRVEQHLRIIFPEVIEVPNNSLKHAPSVIADMKESSSFIPPKLRRQLSAKQL